MISLSVKECSIGRLEVYVMSHMHAIMLIGAMYSLLLTKKISGMTVGLQHLIQSETYAS